MIASPSIGLVIPRGQAAYLSLPLPPAHHLNMKQPTIPNGLQPRYTHLRQADDDFNVSATTHQLKSWKMRPAAHGGYTQCKLVDPTGHVVATGIAACSKRDQFNRTVGRTIALGRAISNLNKKESK